MCFQSKLHSYRGCLETVAATAGQGVCGVGSGAAKPRDACGVLTSPQRLLHRQLSVVPRQPRSCLPGDMYFIDCQFIHIFTLQITQGSPWLSNTVTHVTGAIRTRTEVALGTPGCFLHRYGSRCLVLAGTNRRSHFVSQVRRTGPEPQAWFSWGPFSFSEQKLLGPREESGFPAPCPPCQDEVLG